MSELQSTIEFSVELYKFYNVDLFQRGMYQVRCSLRVSSKLSVEVEVTTPEVSTGLGTAIVLGNYGACRPFQILYRNEEIPLKDVVLFRCHMLVDGNNLKESLERAEFSLVLELWFGETSPVSMVLVSARTLQLNLSPAEGLHYHLPVLFDYFHLSAVSLTIHAGLTALHQPSIKRGLLRYMQSCAPKSSKSWSKIRSAHCSSLTDPVLPVSSHKIYSRINESPQVHLEARDVLLDASNNLKATIKEYKILFMQREETLSENYDTLVLKPHRYETRNKPVNKKHMQVVSGGNSCLAELCADNIRLWNYFLLNFSCKTTIQQFLSKKHHNLRVRRFAELFFLVYNPRRSAIGCFDTNYQNYLLVAEIAKRSKYMQNLPPLPVHCAALDGDNATMPIIFEDQYQDPFQQDQPLSSKTAEVSSFKRSKTLLEDQCSCGASNDVWELRKSSNYEAVPARHSKSLDQLQLCSTNGLHHSFSNIPGNTGKINQKSHKTELKNVASEHNMRTKSHVPNKTENECSCGNSYYLNLIKNSKKSIDLDQIEADILGNKYKEFDSMGEKAFSPPKIVKSLSHTCSDYDTQSIFRSNSMQIFSPKGEKIGDKFSSLSMSKRNKFGADVYVVEVNGSLLPPPRSHRNNHPLNLNGDNKQLFELGSTTSTSTESLLILSKNEKTTGSQNRKQTIRDSLLFNVDDDDYEGSNGVRKVRSFSCLFDDGAPMALSGTESLPNIVNPNKCEIGKTRLYPETRYLSSSTSSSTTSEASGWITSKSSSMASSITDVGVARATSSAALIHNIGSIQRRILGIASERQTRRRTKKEKKQTNGILKKFDRDHLPTKGCEFNQTNLCEDIALLPPKQFRDLESPSSSITNDTNNEEEINAVDNILYHVVDTQTTLERKPNSQFNNRLKNEPEDFSVRGSKSESEKAFQRARADFKSQLNFPGVLYSDFTTFASAVPYFHISDEFRIFSPEGMHLIVCVHGLDGNSADLRLVKTYLELGLPGAYLDFLMSERNQGDTFSDFDTMTDRLVSEILHYLDSSASGPTRISFVGHSLGNVIIRSALTRPQMKFLLPRLHTFLSLSGPHLGTLYNSSGLVNMGMWFMQKWKKSGSLLQLCLKDSSDARQSFLYRLSQKSNIHHFKNVLLCGSGQDRYVPLHSARVELCKESIKDTSDQGAIYREMVHNVISPIIARKEVNLVRYDIHHALPNTANALIGRAAHIAVLDSELFIEKFMAVVGIKYFR